MTAPELPEMLKEIAGALNEKTRFPVELWDAVPPDALIRMVAENNVAEQLPRDVVGLSITAWRIKCDEAKSRSKEVRSNDSKVVETLASTIGKLSSTGAVGADGY